MSAKLTNTAALVRDDITTLNAYFENRNGYSAAYTFKTTLTLANIANPGDHVIVDTTHGIRAAIVSEIHDEPQIDPDASFIYRWAFDIVHTRFLDRELATESQLAKKLERQRRKNLQRQALRELGISEDADIKELFNADS